MSTIACANIVDENYIIANTESVTVNSNGEHEIFYTVLSAFKVQSTVDSANETFKRIFGTNRYETSLAAADALKEVLDVEKFDNIIVASGIDFPDALSGSYLAIMKNAPILLVDEKHIENTIEYITKNLRARGTVYILGGTMSVPQQMDDALNGYIVKRLAGINRYETNLEILAETGIDDNEILICTGTGYADSLSASAVGKPILLVGKTLTSDQKALLSESFREFIIIGGTTAVNEDIETELQAYGTVERIGGANRYETSVLVAKRFFNNPDSVALTYAWNFPDGLCGGALVHAMHSPLLLTRPCCEKAADSYTTEYNITNGVVLGGPSLISNDSANIIFTDAVYTGHDYKEIVTDPTCTNNGCTIYTCNECGNSYQGNTIKATGHNYVVTTVEATTGWGGYDYHECSVCGYSYKDNETDQLSASEWPKGYRDDTCTITIYKEWYENAYVYAAHLEFTDYTRFGTDCANGAYNNGKETTSHAAKRLDAIFTVNGCYSSPNLNYTVVRGGKIWNGSGRATFICPAIYSFYNGKLLSAWEGSQGTPGISGGQIDQLVADGKVTDSFCFGPPNLINGVVSGKNEGTRAQRTFIGTNGNPGDIWVCVSDGRYNDGKSAGLTFYQGAAYLKSKGCTFGVHLDGGGSSTMYFNGSVLNAAKGRERAVVDFVYFK